MRDEDRAAILDVIYASGTGKDYAGEASELARIVLERAPDSSSVLGVGCGGGLHLMELRDHFSRVEGTEIFEAMCARARARVGDIPIHLAAAETLDLAVVFDAIVVLFSTISRAPTQAALIETLRNLARHLRPGGVLVTDPWYTPEDWPDEPFGHVVATDEDQLVVRVAHVTRSGRSSTSHMTYIWGRHPEGVAVFQESRDLTLFTHPEYLQAFRDAGLSRAEIVQAPPRMRPRVVGIRPSPQARLPRASDEGTGTEGSSTIEKRRP